MSCPLGILRAHEGDHLVIGHLDEPPRNLCAEKPGCAGEQNDGAHVTTSQPRSCANNRRSLRLACALVRCSSYPRRRDSFSRAGFDNSFSTRSLSSAHGFCLCPSRKNSSTRPSSS